MPLCYNNYIPIIIIKWPYFFDLGTFETGLLAFMTDLQANSLWMRPLNFPAILLVLIPYTQKSTSRGCTHPNQRPAIPGIGIEVLVSRPVLVLVLVLQFRFSRYWYWYWYWPFAISKYWYWYWYWPFCQSIPIPNSWHKKVQKTQFAWVKVKK